MAKATDLMMQMIQQFDQPQVVDQLVDEFYASNAVFQDPLQRVEGRDAIKGMFRSFTKLFKGVSADVIDEVSENDRTVVRWVMTFDYRGWPAAATVEGVTWLQLNDHGQCVAHTDFWDLWAFFKGSLPFSGAMKRLREKAGLKKPT